MPQTTPAEATARDQALARANLEAARVPLRTAEACLELSRIALTAAKSGNANAITDAGVAGLMARAGGEGALLNVQINLKSLPESADKEDVMKRLRHTRDALGQAGREVEGAVRTTLDAS
jgi:formiminotetrahydrofolate cyclodeaminase